MPNLTPITSVPRLQRVIQYYATHTPVNNRRSGICQKKLSWENVQGGKCRGRPGKCTRGNVRSGCMDTVPKWHKRNLVTLNITLLLLEISPSNLVIANTRSPTNLLNFS